MIAFTLGYWLDILIGDPKSFYHPVQAFGATINFLERKLLKDNLSKTAKKLRGFILLGLLMGIGFLIPLIIIKLAYEVHPLLALFIEGWMLFQAFATRQLDRESKLVYKALKENDIVKARKYISYLVSRDTENMTEEDILKASIETISENIGDGILAPLFFACIGGAPLVWTYKAVNTLDSMVGYKNEKYEDFGYASAKFDDLLNFIPARLTSVFILFSGLLLKMNFKQGLKILIRDRRNHASPNSAYPEAATAGLLNIQLGGKASYFGVISQKATMGDQNKKIDLYDLKKTSQLLYLTSLIAWVVFAFFIYIWRGL
jgi:adenosylcobinamide-phosphate synthase